MERYCTLFDARYLDRGLALHESLVRSGASFHLYIFPFDRTAHLVLQQLHLPQVTIVALEDFENPDLLRVKSTRSTGEYCWTCTPHIISYTLRHFSLDRVTYLDADIYFFSDPSILLREFDGSSGSVMITDHRYTPVHDHSATSGRFCVQFITFRSDISGFLALDWWKDRCIEWCYARAEEGKFGDQKYLDDWLTRFSGVHVLEHLGGGMAPWNAQQYTVTRGVKSPLGTSLVDGRTFDVVFYHFHDLTFYCHGEAYVGAYDLPVNVINELYYPYLNHLAQVKRKLGHINRALPSLMEDQRTSSVRTLLRYIKRKLLHRDRILKCSA